MSNNQTKIKIFAICIIFVLLIIWAFFPKPVEVDLAQAQRRDLLITVNNEGKTRVKERYTISAPIEGRLERIELKAGDKIEKEGSTIAVIEPFDPALLDVRTRSEAEAKLAAAEAAKDRAITIKDKAGVLHQQAEKELKRVTLLSGSGAVSKQDFDKLNFQEQIAAAELRAADFSLKISNFEINQAQAALMQNTSSKHAENANRFEIPSPIKGVVLRVFQESSTVVSPGTKLLEIGDPNDIECEVEVLSRDAVRIEPGQKVIFEYWGGEKPLEGRVRLREPSGFTKISVLGVEEQRVNIIVDLINPLEERLTLEDAYRVEAKIIIAERKNVISVPAGALFRNGDSWVAFLVRGHRAHLIPVKLGLSNGLQTEIVEGLKEGDNIVLHPSDRLTDGSRIKVH